MKRTLRVTLAGQRTEVPGVLIYGLGAIGAAVARALIADDRYEILGVVDADPAKAGRPLAELLDLDEGGLPAVSTELPVMAPEGAVALHMAGSSLTRIKDDLIELMRMGYAVASSAEELLYAPLQQPAVAEELDAVARACGVCISGVGVNPGFVMDFLPVAAATICREVTRVEVTRVVDAATRREPLQRKIGSGLRPEEFERLAQAGQIGHVGLIESCAFVADALGLPLDAIEEELNPVVAESRIRTRHLVVEAGQVCGIDHQARGFYKGKLHLSLDLRMYLGAADPHDEVRLTGDPPLTLRVEGGAPGDSATVAALVNAIPRVAAATPGLHSVRTLPLVV